MSKKTIKAPKTIKTTNDKSGAPLVTARATIIAPETTNNVGAALAALDKKLDDVSAPTSSSGATTTGATTYALAPLGAGANAFGGRIGASTHALDMALCDAAARATNDNLQLLTSKQLHAAHVTICELHNWRPRVQSATAPHVSDALRARQIVRINGAYCLSNHGRKLVQLAPLSVLAPYDASENK